MAADLHDLARTAVASPWWRWLPGSLAIEVAAPGMSLYRDGRQRVIDAADVACGVWLPDLTDACTLGGLLALVREAWGRPTLYLRPDVEDLGKLTGWTLWLPDGHCYLDRDYRPFGHGDTEAEALVSALLCAPDRDTGAAGGEVDG